MWAFEWTKPRRLATPATQLANRVLRMMLLALFFYLASSSAVASGGGVTTKDLSTTASWVAEGEQVEAYFGYSVSTAGDVNGDGFADIIVGAYWYNNDQINEGRVYVYYASSTGLTTSSADWTAEGDQAEAAFGWSVSTAGDVNNDGYDDIIVGAVEYDNGQVNEGRAFVYHGSATGLSPTADWTAEADQGYADFGYVVSSAGDINGDGFDDVIIGAIYYDNGEFDEGRAFVYHGSATGLSSSPDWTAESNNAAEYFSASVGTARDVNGDGFDDVIIGASTYDNGQNNEGRACVYYGSASGLSSSADWMFEGDQEGAFFGRSVSTAGDVNNDGYADVIIGADYYSNGQGSEGAAFVYYGSGSGLSASPDWRAESDTAGANLGKSVGTAGDVNADGYADVVISAPQYQNGQTFEGIVFAYEGSGSGLSTTATWKVESNYENAHFGNSVSTAGDVNGDGVDDIVVGAPQYTNGESDEGAAFLFLASAPPPTPTPTATPTATLTPTPSPTPGITPVASYDFDTGPEGWTFRTPSPTTVHVSHWANCTSVDPPTALGIDSPYDETTNYFAFWDSFDATAVPYVADSLYQVNWNFSTNRASTNSVPSFRFRIGLTNQKAFAYSRAYPGDWLPLAQTPGITIYELFFDPPHRRSGTLHGLCHD